MDFKEKNKVAKLRQLIGKVCLHRTLRGWLPAGTITAIELRGEEIYLVVKDGIRRNHEKHLPLKRCKVKDQAEKDATLSKLDITKQKREDDKEKSDKEEIADKMKKLKEAKRRQDYVSGQSASTEW